MNISILDFKLKKMKLFNLSAIILLLCIGSFFNTLLSQVTIGSSIKPAQGALLDLKQKEDTESINGGSNSKLGLLLPRVALEEVNKLIMGNTIIQDADNGGDQYVKHAGLVVYNVTTNNTLCPGLYVWSGSQWDRLFDDDCVVAPKLELDIDAPEPLFFYNGQYGSTDYSKDIIVTWNPEDSEPTYEIVNIAGYAPVSLGGSGTINPNLPWTTPQTVQLTPAPMSQADLDSDPFLVKKSKLKVNLVEGEEEVSKEVELEQENKALLIDGSTNPKVIKLKPTQTQYIFNTQANAKWRLLSNNIGGGSGIQDASKYEGGTEMKVLPGGNRPSTESVMLTARTGAAKPYSYLTLTDAETPKRFHDVYITIIQCGPGEDSQTLLDYWRVLYDKYGIMTPDTSGDLNKNKNQVQFHKDQNGNMFFSAMFGSDRWMTTNLAATKYAADSPHANKTLRVGINNYNSDAGYYAYPGPDTNGTVASYYNARPRLGLLYSWYTATGESTTTPTTDPGDQWSSNYTPKQGICPSGWHLPSPQEFMRLEMELNAHAQKYSSNLEITKTTATVRDMCDINPTKGVEGQSHTLVDGGFSIIYTGAAGQPVTTDGTTIVPGKKETFSYGDSGQFWTSATSNNYKYAYFLSANIYENTLGASERNPVSKESMVSVRCVKNK